LRADAFCHHQHFVLGCDPLQQFRRGFVVRVLRHELAAHGEVKDGSAQLLDLVGAAGIPYRAWLLLNRTFASESISERAETGLAIVPACFCACAVPTFASRLPEFEAEFDASFDEDSASLLYMATEAFFGVLVFALFLDRLRGKRRGVTAMMHYSIYPA
jgi:hypothetical protein